MAGYRESKGVVELVFKEASINQFQNFPSLKIA